MKATKNADKTISITLTDEEMGLMSVAIINAMEEFNWASQYENAEVMEDLFTQLAELEKVGN